jgi:hypothetical protein
MKNRQEWVVGTALAAALLLVSPPASRAAVGSMKTLVEACGVTDGDLAKAIGSDVALVDVGAVSRNADGTYRLTTREYTAGAGSLTLCSDSRFYGQTMVSGLPFRSAVQVGPDLVLTAWHNPTFGTTPALYAIFGLRYRLAGGRCIPPDFERIPAADVYSVTEVAADGLSSPAAPPRDFLLLRLDRQVSAVYPRVRRSGRGRGDAGHHDRVTMISHPDRLAAKMDLAGRLVGHSDPDYTGPEVENLHPLQWSSGGMVYNRDQRFVETVVRSVVSARYSVTSQSCWRVIHVEGHKATNDSVADFAQNIPAFELLVTPLDAVVHEVDAGGQLSNPTTTRTIEAPVTAPGDIGYRIVPPPITAGGPELLVTFSGPLEGTLAPGTGLDVEEMINASGVACGEYEVAYSVTDATNGFTDVIRHLFRIKCP